jgi:hypothetical protein
MLRTVISSIEFPSIFNTNTRTYCTINSNELPKNALNIFAGFVEKYLVMYIVSGWYRRRNLIDLANDCAAEKLEAENGIRDLLSMKFAELRLDDLNLGIGGCI